MSRLTVAKLRSARHPGGATTRPSTVCDGGGLYLQITPSNSKSWIFRFRRKGKSREMGLGSADPDGRSGPSLAQARIKAAEAKKLLQSGIDPIKERDRIQRELTQAEQRGREQTFRKAAEGCMAAKRDGWKNKKHAQQWEMTLKIYAYPILGDMDVAEIYVNDVLAVLKPIWGTVPESASRLRQRIEAVLDYAAAPARQWRSTENPARWRGVLEHELPKKSKVRPVRHHPSLPHEEVNAFISSMAEHTGMAAQALMLMILTACRSNEVLGATWAEINEEKAVWTIPAKRMKGGRVHRVPLSPQALSVLREAKAAYGWQGSLVFPSPRTGTVLSDMALSQLVRGMAFDGLEEGAPPRWRDPEEENRAIVPHGFRATFKGWTRVKGYADHMSEIALAHNDKNKTRAAYARDDMLEERRPMMDAWARYCTNGPATILAMPRVQRG